MRIALLGASGTIGGAIAATLGGRHEIVPVSHRGSGLTVDLASAESVRALIASLGAVDAIVCAAGRSRRGPLATLTDADFAYSLANKLMGQVNLTRLAFDALADLGSITLTSGALGHAPAPGTAAISMVNAAIEGFVRAAAIEAPRGIRVNVVSPPWVTETLVARGQPAHGSVPVATVAAAYAQSVEGTASGQVLTITPAHDEMA